MHTASDLKGSQFDVRVDGQPGGWAEVFPGWATHDRFGIVVTEPMGALGASLLIQLAIVAFYDVLPERRSAPPRYPEIYLFHVGGRFGDFNAFDFWPPRKEIFLPAVPTTVLEALNDYAITRLAVPDGVSRPGEFAHKEPAAAAERIASSFAYCADGRTEDADIELRARDAILHRYVDRTLDPLATLAAARGAPLVRDPVRLRDRLRWLAQFEARAGEVAAPVIERTRDACAVNRTGGLVCETVRRLTVAAALERLTIQSHTVPAPPR